MPILFYQLWLCHYPDTASFVEMVRTGRTTFKACQGCRQMRARVSPSTSRGLTLALPPPSICRVEDPQHDHPCLCLARDIPQIVIDTKSKCNGLELTCLLLPRYSATARVLASDACHLISLVSTPSVPTKTKTSCVDYETSSWRTKRPAAPYLRL